MKFYAYTDDGPMTRRERIIIGITDCLLILAIVAFFGSLLGCSTARRVVCPETKIVRVVEAEHSYLVTYLSECREHTEEVKK